MSRKNAFAFRDFDKDRILSRKFFSSLNLPTGSDEEILRSFPVDTVDRAEKSIVAFVDIRQRLKIYIERIMKHTLKLDNAKKDYAVLAMSEGEENSFKKFFEKSKLLRDKHLEIIEVIQNLRKQIQNLIDSCDNLTATYYQKRFASRLKQAREKAGLTQKELADVIGINRSDLVLFENAKKTPSFTTLSKILRRTNFSADALLN